MTTTEKEVIRYGGFPSFCIYGRSGSGKTPQIGVLAQRVCKESGGKREGDKIVGGWRTRLYTRDRGGYDSILPEIELGLIELVDLRGADAPWIWMAKASHGRRPTKMVPDLPGRLDVRSPWTRTMCRETLDGGHRIGVWAFEGLTEFGDAVMADLRAQTAAGNNVGGGDITMLDIQEGEGDNAEDFSYAFNNRTHYLMGQNRMNDLISATMALPGFLIWTAIDLRSDEKDSARQVFGPDVGVGKAMTPKIPQKFTYTWRTVNTAKKGEHPRHVLYMMTHQDPILPTVTCVCNARYPKDLPDEEKVAFVEPADIGKAYDIVKTAREHVKQSILDRF